MIWVHLYFIGFVQKDPEPKDKAKPACAHDSRGTCVAGTHKMEGA